MMKTKRGILQIRSSDSKDSDMCKADKIPYYLFEISIAWLWGFEFREVNFLL